MKIKIPNASNLLLAAPFIYALLYPANNTLFIKETSIIIFISEFLTIHASGMINMNKLLDTKKKIILFCTYAIFLTGLIGITKSPELLFFLIFSFFTKIFIHRDEDLTETFIKPMLVLLASVFIVSIFSNLPSITMSITGDLSINYATNSKGIFSDSPQTILIWGIIYPLGLYLASYWKVKFPIVKHYENNQQSQRNNN